MSSVSTTTGTGWIHSQICPFHRQNVLFRNSFPRFHSLLYQLSYRRYFNCALCQVWPTKVIHLSMDSLHVQWSTCTHSWPTVLAPIALSHAHNMAWTTVVSLRKIATKSLRPILKHLAITGEPWWFIIFRLTFPCVCLSSIAGGGIRRAEGKVRQTCTYVGPGESIQCYIFVRRKGN